MFQRPHFVCHPLDVKWLTSSDEFQAEQLTHTHNRLTVVGPTWVSRYQKKHSPTLTHPGHRTFFINFLHLQRSIASSVFSLRARLSSLTTSLQVLFGLPLGLGPSTSYRLSRRNDSNNKQWFAHYTTTTTLHPFNGLFSRTTWVSQHQKIQWI